MSTNQLNLEADTWREEGPWLLLLIAPFAALAFRKGWLGAVLVFILLPLPQTSQALSWDELWQNQNQRAQAALKQGQAQQAAEQFNDKQWQAAAYYKAQNYEKAVELLDNSSAPEDTYNKGNALARLGRIQEAIEAYDAVLESSPGHEDALYNKELLEKYLQQQQNQNGESDQRQQSNQQNDQQNQQDSQNQQADSGQSQDQSGEPDSQQSQQGQQSQSQQDQQNPQQKNAQSAEKDSSSDEQTGDEQSAQTQQSADQQEAEKAWQQHQQQQAQQEQKDQQEQNAQDTTDQQMATMSPEVDQSELETMQAHEQWLRRIPDDPGGLLRRKFSYQSQLNTQQNPRQNSAQNREEEPW